MSNRHQHFWRVLFADGSSRVVLAISPEWAQGVGVKAQRVTGAKGKLACRAVRAFDEGHAGSGAESCPRCRENAAAGRTPRRTVTMAEAFDLHGYYGEANDGRVAT